jgi:hypothetical protein
MGQLHDRMAQDLVLRNFSPETARNYLLNGRKFAVKPLRSGNSVGASRPSSAPPRLDHARASPPLTTTERCDPARRQKMSRAR